VTGLMLARSISNNSKIIFTTAYREYAVDAFELDAFDYLMKPISLERLLKTISRLDTTLHDKVQSNTADFSFFKCDRRMVKVNFDAIKFVESCGDYVKLHLENTIIVTRETMKEILEKLPKNIFLRVHRSFII
jgi:DNA-binding LytR/AlgR family response regulator